MDDVAETGGGDSGLIDECVEEAYRLLEFLSETGDESCPERCDSAGSANDYVCSFAANLVAGGRIGVSGNVGYPAATAGSGGLWGHGHGGLIRRRREELANAASASLADRFTGGWVGDDGVPDGLAGDCATGNKQVGSAATEGVGGGSREINGQSGGSIERTVVARGYADRYSQLRSVRQGGFKLRAHLGGEAALCFAPTDGNDGGLRRSGNGCIQRIEEPLVAGIREIDDLFRAGRERTRDLHVKRDFQFLCGGGWRLRRTRNLVAASIYRNDADWWCGDAKALIEAVEICLEEATVKLDDGDDLACSVKPCWKVVELAYCDWRKGLCGYSFGNGSRNDPLYTRLGVGAIVQADNGGDDRQETFGNGDVSLAEPVGFTFDFSMVKSNAKSAGEVAN